MPVRETLADYYHQYGRGCPPAGQVSAYRLEDAATPATFPHLRRDFYKIKLLCGAQGILSYADQRVAVQSCALVFANPFMPYSWERTVGRETGFACLFTDEFITQELKIPSLAGSPLFRVGGNPVLFPPAAVVGRLRHLFEQLLAELQAPYVHQADLVRNYVQLLLHESLKLAPAAAFCPPATAAVRLSTLFLDLLDGQFPCTAPAQPLRLRQATEFARQLGVHPSHLNKALKETTGKTTTAHLAGKLLQEAKTLLRHPAWSLADISYGLGFEHAASFTAFFKRHTGLAPLRYRQQPLLLAQEMA
jgi:AraC family transcriptional activator of pobA